MTRTLVATLAILALSGPIAGCSDDCQKLADIACQKAGEDSEECKKVREQAATPSAEDKEACSLALKVVDEFVRQP